MLAKTKAIVLRNTNYRENSVICKMYTREHGMRTYILQSIRKGKAAIKPSMIQPLSLIQMVAYEKPNAGINRIKELKNVPLLLEIHDDIVKKSIALFLVEILNQCITEEQCEEELFDFIETKILTLESSDTPKYFPISFLLELTHYLGVEPQGIHSASTPYFSIDEGIFVAELGLNTLSLELSIALSGFTNSENTSLPNMSASLRRDLLDSVIKYYQFHITKNKRIKSVEILSELLS